MSDVSFTFEPEKVSVEALAHLGEGHIAYVKQVRSEDVPGLFPQAPKIAPGLKLFALHAADGTPIMLTDSREAAIANAWSNRHERHTSRDRQHGSRLHGDRERWLSRVVARAAWERRRCALLLSGG